MAKIKSKKTKPEMYIRSLLFKNGMRFRVNYPDVIGKPDLYFTKYRVAVFVNGCFWHRHKNCKYAYTPKSNIDFWNQKFRKNVQRDKNIVNKLLYEKIRILIIWECSVKKMMKDATFNEEVNKTTIKFICESHEKFMQI